MLLGNFLLELLFVGQNVALPGCDCLFLTNPNFLCNLKMVKKKKRKKADVYFLSTSKLTGPTSYPAFFMHYIQIRTQMRLGTWDSRPFSRFHGCYALRGKGSKRQLELLNRKPRKTTQSCFKHETVFWSHVNVSDCVTSSCHALTSVGYVNVSHHSLKTHETQFKPDW